MKKLFSIFVAFLPISSRLRSLLYGFFPGYAIGGGCRVGFGTMIHVKKFQSEKNVVMGRFNCFSGPGEVLFKENCIIGSSNKFLCGTWAEQKARFQKKFSAGTSVRITDGHYIDFTGLIEIGDRSWLAGYQSQLWTHGAAKPKTTISVGSDCYIGSAVRMCPGSRIGDRCTIGIGSVVTKEFFENDQTLVGIPAKPLAP